MKEILPYDKVKDIVKRAFNMDLAQTANQKQNDVISDETLERMCTKAYELYKARKEVK